MDLDKALQTHAGWKIKLRMAINKQETLDAVAIAKDNLCDLGQWLHASSNTPVGQHPSFKHLLSKHKEFHAEAARVAREINAKRYDEAKAMIGPGSAYVTISTAIAAALMQMKKDTKP